MNVDSDTSPVKIGKQFSLFIKQTTMKYNLCLILALLPYFSYSQTDKVQGKCGDTLEREFKNTKETQEIELSMGAGDQFEIMVVPLGDDLKIRAELYNPDNQLMVTEEPTDLMFKDETVRSITLTSGEIKSNGTFKLRLFNYNVEPDKTGIYNTYIKCIMSNGDILKPK
jgi:hypothetical protein